MDKTELLHAIGSAHDELAALVDRISDDRLLDPAMDGWTGKDLLAHLAWWQGHSAQLLEDFRADRTPEFETHPGSTVDQVNEYVYERHRHDPPKAARVALAESYQRLLAAIEPLTADDLFSPGRCSWLDGRALSEMILGDSENHYREHLPHFESLIASAPN